MSTSFFRALAGTRHHIRYKTMKGGSGGKMGVKGIPRGE